MTAQSTSDWRLRHRVVHGILWRLGRIGIRVTLFVGIREGARVQEPVSPGGEFAFSELTIADLGAFDQLGDREDDSAKALARFNQGNLCFGLRAGDRLVAKTWCDLESVTYPHCRRRVRPGEVYLLAAYADPAYRGRGLAPALRSTCYAELRKRGYTRFYSFSEYLNLPARRFKKKLGAVEEDLRIHCDFGGKWERTIMFKRPHL